MTSLLLLLVGLSFAEDTTVRSVDDDTVGVPATVEQGSVRKLHTAKVGETLESIALDFGFAPTTVRNWNPIDGDLAAGDEVVLWIPPPEPESEITDAAPTGSTQQTVDGHQGFGGFVGAHVGSAFSLSPLSTAFTPRIEGGILLPMAERSFRVFVGGQYRKPVASGEGQDDSVAGDWDYEMKQDELSIHFGVGFRPGMIERKIKPEVSVGPNVYLYRSTVSGAAGGAAFPESVEQHTGVGIYASGGASMDLGPGELAVLLTLTHSGLDGLITGMASNTALSPSLGYRLVL